MLRSIPRPAALASPSFLGVIATLAAALLFHGAPACVAAQPAASSTDALRARWQKAATPQARAQAACALATAYLADGYQREARELLEHSLDSLTTAKAEPVVKAPVQAALGAALLYTKQTERAEELLRDAEHQISTAKAPLEHARILNSLASLLSRRSLHDEALAKFTLAARLAKSDQELLGAITANHALALIQAGAFDKARDRARSVLATTAKQAPSPTRTDSLLRAGGVLEALERNATADTDTAADRIDALAAYRAAAAMAAELPLPALESTAQGNAAHLYELEHRPKEALELTRHALFRAQQARNQDLLVRWQWQAGRLLRDTGDLDPAIDSLRRASATLSSIRTDIALRHGHPLAANSFRDTVGGLFLDLADLLLQKAAATSGEQAQTFLHEARDTAEQLKSAELEDYFQDECVSLAKAHTKGVEQLAHDAAILYVIPLRDRTEILLGRHGKLERFKTDATASQLNATATRFRENLENRLSNAHLLDGRQLYDWIIRPLLPSLQDAKTLVFVPDGALRTVPIAALHDGEHFLCEQFAIAVTPGLSLMEAQPIDRSNARILLSGLSEARQNFPPLPHVPGELHRLQELFQGRLLMNRDFVPKALQDEVRAQPFNIVHIASHGHFDRDAEKCFLLTYDSQLTLNQMERLLRPSALRDQPIELLTLSACQTAAGDDRAALGLAGVAIKAGARSAFATLWFVNDEACANLVTNFYSHLHDHPEWSKARALQTAQQSLLKDPRYTHPSFWAPYLLIGNWL